MERIHLLLKVGILLCAFGLAKNAAACSPSAQISGWKNFLLPKDVLNLTAPAGAKAYQWYVNGVQSNTTATFTFSPTRTGTYIIQLILDNDTCHDTSAVHVLTVAGCGNYDQNQKMIWALEDSMMLDFNSAPPSCFIGGSMHGLISPGPFYMGANLEASTSMCNDVGELLFYSNGNLVWDKNHQVMPNGAGLMGHFSSLQGSLSFPDPGNKDLYYLFTLDAGENFYANGFRYSIIDMRRRGGLGNVAIGAKNVLVDTTLLEVMDGTYHANKNDVWVVVAKADSVWPSMFQFDSYLVTGQGVSGPVSTLSLFINGNWRYPGFMKFSHDGKWLAAGKTLYKFDNQTGQIQYFADLSSAVPYFSQGVEFSPDNTKLYYSFFLGQILQLDLSIPTVTSILNSGTLVYPTPISPPFALFSKLELGPDNQIYVTSLLSSALGIITAPNQPGVACSYVHNGVAYPRPPAWKSMNLPTYLSGRYTNDSLKIATNDSTPCIGDSIRVWPLQTIGTYAFSYFVDGDSTHEMVGDTLINFVPQKAGPLAIIGRLENACGYFWDTLWIDVQPLPEVDLGDDIMLCDDSLLLDMRHLLPGTFLWSDNSTQPFLNVIQPGFYGLQFTESSMGCKAADTIEVIRRPIIFQPNLGRDTTFCSGGSVFLQVKRGEGEIRWWNGSSDESLSVSTSGWYWVEITDTCGRRLVDSIHIEVLAPASRTVVDSLFFCKGEDVSVDMDLPGFNGYRWNDGVTSTLRSFASPGRFFLESIDISGCNFRDTLDVIQFPDPPVLNLAAIDSICQGESLKIDATTDGIVFYTWTDGPEEPVRNVNQAGSLTLEAIDLHGCHTSAGIEIRLFNAIQLEIPKIYFFCKDEVSILDVASDSFVSYRWHDGLTHPIREVDSAGIYTIEVEDIYHCNSTSSTEVRISPCRPLSFMPSAFSPNADGINENFGPSWQEGITGYDLKIFNRWGQKVYESTDPFPGWDGNHQGSTCPEGVYIYSLSYYTDLQTVSHVQGTVTLFR